MNLCVCVCLTSQDLVEKDFDVIGAQGLRRHDDLMKVTLHQLRHHITAVRAMSRETIMPKITAGSSDTTATLHMMDSIITRLKTVDGGGGQWEIGRGHEEDCIKETTLQLRANIIDYSNNPSSISAIRPFSTTFFH